MSESSEHPPKLDYQPRAIGEEETPTFFAMLLSTAAVVLGLIFLAILALLAFRAFVYALQH